MGEVFGALIGRGLPVWDQNLAVLVCFLFFGASVLLSSLTKGTEVAKQASRASKVAVKRCFSRRQSRNGFERIRGVNPIYVIVFAGVICVHRYGIVLVGSRAVTVAGLSWLTNGITRLHKKDLSDDEWGSEVAKVSVMRPEFKRVWFLRMIIPSRSISRMWGAVAKLSLPTDNVRKAVLGSYASFFGCDIQEMKFPIEKYCNLNSFFLRTLKDGSRKVCSHPSAIVSPVDGRVMHLQSIVLDENFNDITLEHVKGFSYTARRFLGTNLKDLGLDHTKRKGRRLNSCVLYLSPGDYHHFHSACEAKFYSRTHIAGTLFPVSPRALDVVPSLYIENERVVLSGEWNQGIFYYVAVGAMNVGSIELEFDSELQTNRLAKSAGEFRKTYEKPVEVIRAEELGLFRLGSTIVLVFESDESFRFDVNVGETVRIGQSLNAISASHEEHQPMSCPPWPSTLN